MCLRPTKTSTNKVILLKPHSTATHFAFHFPFRKVKAVSPNYSPQPQEKHPTKPVADEEKHMGLGTGN